MQQMRNSKTRAKPGEARSFEMHSRNHQRDFFLLYFFAS